MRSRLGAVPGLEIIESAPLRDYTRFGIGGPARLLADASSEPELVEAMRMIQESGEEYAVIGGGTNLIVSDDGFAGVVLRYASRAIEIDRTNVRVAAGAVLQEAGRLGHRGRLARPRDHDRNSRLGGRRDLWQRRRLRPLHS